MRPNFRYFAFLTCFFVVAAPATADEGLRTSRHDLDVALQTFAKEDGADISKIAVAMSAQEPLFIFVPGILGSRLKDGQTEIWGTLGWSDVSAHKKKLYYKEGATTDPTFLDSFKVLGVERDVYGEFFKRVRDLNFGKVEHLVQFPYDWRQDLRATAAKFDRVIRSSEWPLKDRGVNIIAHSMGGLVVTYWYHKHYKGNEKSYPFNELREVIFLGTPHRGSVAALASLIDGYSCVACGDFEKKIFKAFFTSLNDASYTFPALFQMLPLDAGSVVAFDRRGLPLRRDHWAIRTWREYRWGEAARRQLGLTEDEFYTRVEALLDNGEKFQKELDSFGPVPNARYFYVNRYQTPSQVKIDSKRVVNYDYEPGDGRVTHTVAKNKPRTNTPDYYRVASVEHGALTTDEAFLAFVYDLC
ncbi:MAG TPA: hypothetical protein VFQ06_07060, partial [Nitrospira sp.]|nr:hypothetical protein [Nitrospira sp.]